MKDMLSFITVSDMIKSVTCNKKHTFPQKLKRSSIKEESFQVRNCNNLIQPSNVITSIVSPWKSFLLFQNNINK